MDVIVLGIHNTNDKNILDSIVSQFDELEICWDYEHFNIEASNGIKVLSKSFKLTETGILLKNNDDGIFSSYPLICEVTDSILNLSGEPSLFQFLKKINSSSISRMILAFADEWEENTLVKIEKCSIDAAIERLNSIFVWCESYVNLVSESELRGDDHPLILRLEND